MYILTVPNILGTMKHYIVSLESEDDLSKAKQFCKALWQTMQEIKHFIGLLTS